jgi:ketosteroid isomerase-like protein
MSQENVLVVRDALEALNRGDMEAAFKNAAPGFTFDLSRAVGTDRGVYDLDQMRRLTEEFGGTWNSVTYGADEFIEAGEHVVTPFTNKLVGRDGIEVQARGAWVWTIRDGAIVRICLYQERGEALEAVGQSE